MRYLWLLLLLAAPALALSPILISHIGGHPETLKTFQSPVAVDIDLDGSDEALIWNREGEVYLLDDLELRLWYNSTEPLLGLAAFGNDVLIATPKALHLFDKWKNEYLGWPRSGNFTDLPVVADLENDGQLEIIVPTKEGLEVSHLYGPAERLPVQNPKLSVGDVNGDGRLEIAATAEGKVYLFDSELKSIDGWPKVVGGKLSTPAIAASRIAVTTSNGDFHVWNADGSEAFSYSSGQQTLSEEIPAPLFVGDLTVFAGPGNEVYVFKDGKEAEDWPVRLENATSLRFNPIAIDIVGDSEPELLVPAGFQLQVLGLDGSLIETYQMDGLVKTPAVLDAGSSAPKILAVSESEPAVAGKPLLVLQVSATQAALEPAAGQQTGQVTANVSDKENFYEDFGAEPPQLFGTLGLANGAGFDYALMKDKLYKSRAKLRLGLLKEENGADYLDYTAASLLNEIHNLRDAGNWTEENAARINGQINALDEKLGRLAGINAGFGVPLENELFISKGLTSIARTGFEAGSSLAERGRAMREPQREKCENYFAAAYSHLSCEKGPAYLVSFVNPFKNPASTACDPVLKSVLTGACSLASWNGIMGAGFEFAGGFVEGLSVFPAIAGSLLRVPQTLWRDAWNGKILQNPYQYTVGGTVATAEYVTDGFVGFANGAIDHPIEAAGQVVGVYAGERAVRQIRLEARTVQRWLTKRGYFRVTKKTVEHMDELRTTDKGEASRLAVIKTVFKLKTDAEAWNLMKQAVANGDELLTPKGYKYTLKHPIQNIDTAITVATDFEKIVRTAWPGE